MPLITVVPEMNLPVAITMGCPVGVGPEIIVRLLEHIGSEGNIPPVILGDFVVLEKTVNMLGSKIRLVKWQPGQECTQGTLPVCVVSSLDVANLSWGNPTRETSLAMAEYVRKAAIDTLSGIYSAMVTCPISKKALNEAGVSFPGHTEMLADLTQTKRYRMMMAGRNLRVVLVTIHEPIAALSDLLSVEEIMDCISMTVQSLSSDFAIQSPRVAIAGLNPHAGEQGMFGTEEIDVITPAVRQYSGPGSISGPWPPDTVFYKAAHGEFDAVIAMYHDQGLIPFKLLHFQDGVNVTLGLPIVRTSVDHGTAYDIAGTGRADYASLEAAWKLAVSITENRRQVNR